MEKISLNNGQDYLIWRQGSGSTIEIYDIVVNSQRRAGVGRQLVQILFKQPQVWPCSTVYAITRTDNLIAQQFYESLGFEVTAVLRRFYARDRSRDAVDAIMYGRGPRGPI